MLKEMGIKRKAFQSRYNGPYVIKKIISSETYEVEDKAGKKFIRHRNQIKPTQVKHNKIKSEDVYSVSSKNKSTRSTVKNQPQFNITTRPQRIRLPVQRYGFQI